MEILKWIGIGIGAVVGLLILDRIMLGLEARGYVYWRKKKASPGTFGNAFLELHSILEPSKKNVIEQRKNVKTEQDDEGDPPET